MFQYSCQGSHSQGMPYPVTALRMAVFKLPDAQARCGRFKLQEPVQITFKLLLFTGVDRRVTGTAGRQICLHLQQQLRQLGVMSA
ncbi:hypothetical protein D9M68_857940 [compost metagenome]